MTKTENDQTSHVILSEKVSAWDIPKGVGWVCIFDSQEVIDHLTVVVGHRGISL